MDNVIQEVFRKDWHGETQEMLSIIGRELGYFVETEKKLNSGIVDVYWEKDNNKIGFEVVDTNTTNIDKDRCDKIKQEVDKLIILNRLSLNHKKDKDHHDFIEALGLYSKGYSISEIARRVDRGQSQVFSWIKGGCAPRTLNKDYANNLRTQMLKR
jgi:hypothetical protein